MSEVSRTLRRASRTAAAALCAAALVALEACGSAAPPAQPPGALPEVAERDAAPTPGAGAEPAPLEILGLELRDEADSVRLELATSGPLVWTSYRDAGGDLVIELPNSLPRDGIADRRSGGLVESAELAVERDGDRPLTRIVVRTTGPAEHSVAAEGSLLVVELARPHGPREVARVADLTPFEPIDSEPVESEPLPEIDAGVVGGDGGTPDQPAPGPEPSGTPATQLQGVEAAGEGDGAVVWVLGDGEFFYSTFVLEDPDRFVVDLSGVLKTVPYSSVTVGHGPVERVRIAQFRAQPELVSRVVIDLTRPASPEVEPTAGGLKISFGVNGDLEPAAEAPAMEPEPAAMEPEPEIEPEVAAEIPIEPVMAADEVVEPEPPAYEPAPEAYQEPVEETLPEPAAPAPPAEEPAAEPVMPPQPAAFRADRDAAPTQVEVAGPAAAEGLRSYEARTLGAAGQVWSGEPVTFSLKDADIKDVLRTFAQLSGLNIVVQPGVTGTVTVELTNVPWDQALEQILKINGLDYQLEGNIMRVAPSAVLRAEAEEQLATARAQALSIPLRTIMRRVSYGSADEIARVLRSGGGASVLSQRGSVVVDRRTNTLIIKELPSIMNTVIAVVDNLDVPEPQVIIEARIIETTKRFTRTLGIQWGFDAVADAAHGNTTGLVFPNNIDAQGGVQLLTGAANGFLGVTLGNVLNTFQLDAVLQAAENEGLINILSAPKITTLNNERASIQSGLQIPIQTIANNTVSVQFINATLRLDVVPHVTAAGTVLMDIDIQKREPQLAFAVQGARNAPISTKDARTRVIVRDGGTTVIGGIYEVTSDQGEDRVPGLSNIPILKHLFKNKRRIDENEELLIFITPRVVKL